MQYRFIVLFFSCLWVSAGWSQTYTTIKTASKKVVELYQKSKALSGEGKDDKALDKLQEALKADPVFIDAYIRMAQLYYDNQIYPQAKERYEKAMALDSLYSPASLFFLAKTEWQLDQFAEAANHASAYIQHPKANEELKVKATLLMNNSRFSAVAMLHPVPFEPKSLGISVNTTFHEYLPSLTADGEKIVFTALVGGQDDLYSSEKKDGIWQKSEPLSGINTEASEGAICIAPDGKYVIFAARGWPDGLGDFDLYYSAQKNGQWSKPVNLGKAVNSPYWDSEPSISADGQSLYFSSKRPGGMGDADIWVCYRQSDGKWGNAQNIGAPVNTPEEDQAPFMHEDGQTLYFTSRGHPGMGEQDIFLSRMQADNTWGTPQNLGYPINTKANEGAMIVSTDGTSAYFASDRTFGKNNGDAPAPKANLDLYSFDLYPEARPLPVTYVKATVRDGQNHRLLSGAKAEFVDLGTGKPFASSLTNENGTFLVCLPAGRDYALNVSQSKYLFFSENINLAEVSTASKPFLMSIELSPVPEATTEVNMQPVILRNVFFDSGSDRLRPESYSELNRLKALLDENPGLKIRINGHTDNVGSDSENLNLSTQRAKAVFDYLIQQGVNAGRLGYAGFGETRPIAPNDTPEGRQQNRRTEFEVAK